MTHVKNTINGMTGVSMAVMTIFTQITLHAQPLITLHAQPLITLLAGIGGLVVIGLTIIVSYKTAKRTDLERLKLEAEIAKLKSSSQ